MIFPDFIEVAIVYFSIISKIRNCLVHAHEVHLGTVTIGHIINRSVGTDTELAGGLDGINVGTDENEFPVVFVFLFFDQRFNFPKSVFATGVFHAIGDDDENDLFCLEAIS